MLFSQIKATHIKMALRNPIIAFIGLVCCLGFVIGLEDETNTKNKEKIPSNKSDNEINFLTHPRSSLKSTFSTGLDLMDKVSKDKIPTNKSNIENAGPLSSLKSIISIGLDSKNEVIRDKMPTHKSDKKNAGPLSSLKSIFSTGLDMDKTPTNTSDNEINYDTDFQSSLKSLLNGLYTQFKKQLGDYYPSLNTSIEAHVEPKEEIKETEEETKEPKMKQETSKSSREESPDIILPFDNFFENRIFESGSLFPDINKIFEQNTSFKNNSKISKITFFDPFYNFFPDIIIQPIQPKQNRSCCMKNKQCSNQHCPNCVKNKTKKAITRKDAANIELINRDLLVCVLPGLLGFIVVVTGVEIIRRHNKMVKTTRFLSPQYNNIQHC